MSIHKQSLLNTIEFLAEAGVTDILENHAGPKRNLEIQSINTKTSSPPKPHNPGVTPQVKDIPTPIITHNKNDQYDLCAQLSEIKTLDELRQAIHNFTGCPLKKTSMNTVFSDGVPDAEIMLVGEAPGADEDRLGLPFVGLSGQLLDKMFKAIGYERTTNLYISNILPWRPPGNRQPSPQEVAQCLPFIEKHIALVKPKVVVCVGGTAVKALLDDAQGITKLRGQFLQYQNSFMSQPCKAFAIFHPAYLLRSPGQKRFVWRDLLTLKEAVKRWG